MIQTWLFEGFRDTETTLPEAFSQAYVVAVVSGVRGGDVLAGEQVSISSTFYKI